MKSLLLKCPSLTFSIEWVPVAARAAQTAVGPRGVVLTPVTDADAGRARAVQVTAAVLAAVLPRPPDLTLTLEVGRPRTVAVRRARVVAATVDSTEYYKIYI